MHNIRHISYVVSQIYFPSVSSMEKREWTFFTFCISLYIPLKSRAQNIGTLMQNLCACLQRSKILFGGKWNIKVVPNALLAEFGLSMPCSIVQFVAQ